MSDLYPVPTGWASTSHCDAAKCRSLYRKSIETPDAFWSEQAAILDWFKRPTLIKTTSFEDDVRIRWYEDGELNVCYNCVDRHLATRANQVAIIWEADDP